MVHMVGHGCSSSNRDRICAAWPGARRSFGTDGQRDRLLAEFGMPTSGCVVHRVWVRPALSLRHRPVRTYAEAVRPERGRFREGLRRSPNSPLEACAEGMWWHMWRPVSRQRSGAGLLAVCMWAAQGWGPSAWPLYYWHTRLLALSAPERVRVMIAFRIRHSRSRGEDLRLGVRPLPDVAPLSLRLPPKRGPRTHTQTHAQRRSTLAAAPRQLCC